MSMSLAQFFSPASQPDADSKCSVLVLYADTPRRERALALCDRLVRQFWSEIDFGFSWWRFRYLEDPELAEAAAQAAATADLIMVAAPATEELPAHVKDWFEHWLPSGSTRDVALIALTDAHRGADLAESPFVAFAQQAARQARLDCLLSSGSARWLADAGVPGGIHERATRVSRVLDEILHHVGGPPTLPTHWGLNE